MVWLIAAGVALAMLLLLARRERRRGRARGVDKRALYQARVRDSRKVTAYLLRR